MRDESNVDNGNSGETNIFPPVLVFIRGVHGARASTATWDVAMGVQLDACGSGAQPLALVRSVPRSFASCEEGALLRVS